MASPITFGTNTGSAISSKDINIISEKIYIKIDKDFKVASYIIDYSIYAEKAGTQIPLLFHASDYEGNFNISIDNNTIELIQIPNIYQHASNSPFDKFSDLFKPAEYDSSLDVIEIKWNEESTYKYRLNDLKYFETELTKGEHHIHIEYNASAWIDESDWVKEYSFRYSLSPAKFWKSFNKLEITIDATAPSMPISTNLGKPEFGKLDSISTWHFTKIPYDYIKIDYKPEISKISKTLISIDPFGLMLLFGISLAIIHILIIIKYRKRNIHKRFSPAVIIGSIIIPFIVLLSLMFFYELIDNIIGKEASRYHGYTFLSVLFYPLAMPIYWIFMWLIDRISKTIYKKKQNRL